MKLQKGLVIPLVLIFGTFFILLSTFQQPTTFAQTTGSETSNSVNDVSLRTVFNFNVGVEEITTFQVFNLLAGYDKQNPPRFELAGIIDGNKPLLHKATHETFHSNVDIFNRFSDFDVEIYISDKDSLNFLVLFENCDIEDFSLDTLYDKNKSYEGTSKFALVETFEFQCTGAHPLHPEVTEGTGESSEEAITNKEPKEKESPTWEDFYP